MHFRDQTRGNFMTAGRLALLSGVLLGGALPAVAEPLITGTANYEVVFDSDASPAAAASISGEMKMSLTRNCTAYATKAAIDLVFTAPTGKAIPLTMRSSLVEDGDRLDFNISGDMGGTQVDRAEGVALLTDDGVNVSIAKPAEKTIAADGPVLFPVAMIEAAIAAAKAGETFAQYQVYDGSGGGEEVWTLSLLISPVAKDEDLGEEGLFAAGLGFGDLDRWRMKFSYFRPGTVGEQMPAFSTEAIIYANGFTMATVYDLGGAAVRLKLIDFAPAAPTPCG